MSVDDFPANRQAQTDAAAVAGSRPVNLIESFKYLWQIAFCNADSRVRNGQDGIVFLGS